MHVKRLIYLAASMVLGFLLQLMIHAALEIWYINRLLDDFERWNFGFSWAELWQIHHVLALILAFLGVAAGYQLGVTWWRIVYIEKRHWCRRR